MSWLKDEASQNIPLIVVTPEVSHELMSSLKGDKENNHDMSVIRLVSQHLMWPWAAVPELPWLTQSPTAVSSSLLLVKVCGAATLQ